MQYVVTPEHVLQGLVQARQLPWGVYEGRVKPGTQPEQIELLMQVEQIEGQDEHFVPLMK